MQASSTLTNAHAALSSSSSVSHISSYVTDRRRSVDGLRERLVANAEKGFAAAKEGAEKGYAVAREGYEVVREGAEKGYEVVREGAEIERDGAGKGFEVMKGSAGKGFEVMKEGAGKGFEAMKEGAGKGFEVMKEGADLGIKWWERRRLAFFKLEDVPHYLQDNNFILTGYRANYTYLENWISLIHLHNESGNVWTHAVAFVWFVGLMVMAFFSELHPNAATSDRIVFAGFLFSASLTFLFSSLFHLHLCHSEKAYITFGCLDYSGFWATAQFRKWRALLYVASGALSGAPFFHYALLHGLSALPSREEYFAVPGLVGMAALYLIGVVLYIARVPERLAPGKFDLLFHSHQFWHVFVIAAAYTHSRAILGFMAWRLDNAQTCPAPL
ncbi:Adiponectin receptor protein 1 [Borealophlyctis nickersoniae]|nr:Adiponectin receptor protein 1 [Borealophlyctis nickersoniae]